MPSPVHGSALENSPFFALRWSRQVSEDVQNTGPSLGTAACCAHHAPGGKAFQTLDSQLKNTAQPHVKYSGHLWVVQEAPVVVSRRHSFESPRLGVSTVGGWGGFLKPFHQNFGHFPVGKLEEGSGHAVWRK